MKWGVSITAFNEPYIEAVINQYKGFADRVVVAVSEKPWHGDIKRDDTAERALKTGAIVRLDDWRQEHHQRNWTMELLRDMDNVIVSHCDTFFTQDDLKTLKDKDFNEMNATCNVLTYWKDFDTVIYPHISLPTLFVKSNAHFNKLINIDDMSGNPEILPITCHHLSWAKPNILSKIKSYGHANEINEVWYNKVYLGFKEGMTDFAPTVASDYKSVLKKPLPAEIRENL